MKSDTLEIFWKALVPVILWGNILLSKVKSNDSSTKGYVFTASLFVALGPPHSTQQRAIPYAYIYMNFEPGFAVRPEFDF